MELRADLSALGLGPLVRLVSGLRDLSEGCTSVEEFAQAACALLHQSLVDGRDSRQTALVRFYGTAQLAALPAAERDFVAALGSTCPLPDDTTCLTLLGTAGTEPAWNDRTRSRGHRVVPLPDTAAVDELPMVAALLGQLGIDAEALTRASSDVVLPSDAEDYRIFHVPQAQDSPLIPAQDFVHEHGIASAVGFGGALPTGEVYAVVLFSTVPVGLLTAQLLGTVALSTSLACMDMLDLPLLTGQAPAERPAGRSLSDTDRSAEKERLVRALLTVHEDVAASEADKAEIALGQAQYEARRAAALAAFALRMNSARTIGEVTEAIFSEALPVLAADGGSLALVNAEATAVVVQSANGFDPEAIRACTSLPLDDALPTTAAARRGRLVLVEDLRSGLASFPALAQVHEDTGGQAFAAYPLLVDGRTLGALTLVWNQPPVFTTSALELLEALAAQTSQALDRARLLELEKRHSETLQRSLLALPRTPVAVEVAVRYVPAAEHAQIGGDWNDVFTAPDGSTVLAVGDVMGHDMLAAAAMGQLRNLLRGIAFARPAAPEVLLSVLESALDGLELPAFATLIVARLSPGGGGDPAGSMLLRWSNAGHPPPLLRTPEGAVRTLDTEPDLMIGVDGSRPRSGHDHVMLPGSTLVLYTDGLVERRTEGVDVGIKRLALALEEHGSSAPDALCDSLMATLSGPPDDDVALVVLRVPAPRS